LYITKQFEISKATLTSRGLPFTKEPLMRHSIALVTGTTSGLGHAAARILAAEGCRQAIIN
jgi:hypothetical protein